MDKESLIKANLIQKEIDAIDSFLRYATNVWEGKFIIEKQKYILRSIAYGMYESKEIYLPTKLKNEVLQVIIDHKDKLIKELEKI